MIVFLLAVVVLIIGAVVAVVLGRTGGMSIGMAEPVTSRAPLALPKGPLGPEDLGMVRLDRALRGYRMDQVDELIDRLRLQLAATPLGTYDASGGRRTPALDWAARLGDPPSTPREDQETGAGRED